jgi:hypothetical protein
MMVDPVTPGSGRAPRVAGGTRAGDGPAHGNGGVVPAPAAPADVAPDTAAPHGPVETPGSTGTAVVHIPPLIPKVPGAHLVWGQLLASEQPLGHEQIAETVGLPGSTVLRVLCALGRAGYVLRVPAGNVRDPRQDVWLLAGGVREGQAVADQNAAASDRVTQHANSQGKATDRDAEPGRQLVPFRPGVPVTWRARAVWRVLADTEQALNEVEIARRAGVSIGTARIVLDRLVHLGAVTYTATAAEDRWQLSSSYRAAPTRPDAHKATPQAVGSGTVVRFGPVTGNRRLAKGELRDMVLTALQHHYPAEFGPTGLAKLLGGYSNGAITNALAKLAAQHLIVLTCQAPKRYAALPPDRRETPDTDN